MLHIIVYYILTIMKNKITYIISNIIIPYMTTTADSTLRSTNNDGSIAITIPKSLAGDSSFNFTVNEKVSIELKDKQIIISKKDE